ncbi:DUF3331 domain-containing protein [Paraburkholderia sp. RAU6.4a]|uniref:DUF3331 domain-containing protein n=1 Tax=Paraburkholderia sp. RAU6.4a TaxID=2991067 RepID=UPI003D1D233D
MSSLSKGSAHVSLSPAASAGSAHAEANDGSAWLVVVKHLEEASSGALRDIAKGVSRNAGPSVRATASGSPGGGSFQNPLCVRVSEPHSRVFTVVEELDEKTVMLSWHDATSGRFTDQRWKLSRARTKTRCVMSGAPVEPGDTVYRPTRQTYPTLTDEDVVLASALGAVKSATADT